MKVARDLSQGALFFPDTTRGKATVNSHHMRKLTDMEPPTKKRKQYAGTYQSSWNGQFQGVVTASKLGSNHDGVVYCGC